MEPETDEGALAWGWAEIAGGSAGFGGFSEGRSWHGAAKQKFNARRIGTEIFAERRR